MIDTTFKFVTAKASPEAGSLDKKQVNVVVKDHQIIKVTHKLPHRYIFHNRA